MTSLGGQEALPRRRSYNARMSLAGSVLSYAIAIQTPSVPLSAQQQQQLRAQGLPAQATGSSKHGESVGHSWINTLTCHSAFALE